MSEQKNIYFLSDFHLGVPNYESSLEREKNVVRFLDSIKNSASEIYLVGDIFDFWFEYKTVAPRGFVRLLGKLAELSDSGIKLHLFTGNHDMWIFDYLPSEVGATLYHSPIERAFSGKTFLIGHGDGLGPGDKGYKFIKKVFASKICQWLFARIHPNAGIAMANFWSGKSRMANQIKDAIYLGDDKEFITIYCNETLKRKNYDYFIFGHRHLPLNILLSNQKSRYINLGEWVVNPHYAVWNGEEMKLIKWE